MQSADAHRCAVCDTDQRRMFGYRGFQYFRCPRCQHVTTYPIPDKRTTAEHYARKFVTGNYQLLREAATDYRAVYDDFIRILTDALSREDGSFRDLKVLDVGCFTGEFLLMLQERGADVHGLELQPEAVEIANERLPGRVIQADVDNAELPELSFDIVSLLGVVEHVSEPVRLIQRSVKLLRPGGVLIVQTPNSTSFLARAMRALWPPYAPVEHIHLFSRESLHRALTELGIADIRFEAHRKKLPLDYVYNMLQNYGPEFHRLARPFYKRLPRGVKNFSGRFYIGEMIMSGRKA